MTTSKELCDRTRATFRQIDHWSRNGWLQANPRVHDSPGYPRSYPAEEVRIAYLLAALSRLDMLGQGNGSPVQWLPELIAHVRAEGLHGLWPLGQREVIIDLDAIARTITGIMP